MTNPAAFRATVHKLQTVPTRGVVQIVIEAKIEELPDIATICTHGAWVAVARLTEDKTEKAPPQKKRWEEMSPAQQAGVLCNDPAFWTFLNETNGLCASNTEQAADKVRKMVGVTSRADIDASSRARILWQAVVSDYRDWQREPAVLG